MKNQLTGEIVSLIDWGEFFRFWKFKEKYPEVLQNTEAKKLFDDANNLLGIIGKQKISCGNATIKKLPATAEDDNILLFDRENKSLHIIRCLRQQMKKPAGEPYLCLADFVGNEIGLFAITAGEELEELAKKSAILDDTYQSLLYTSLSQRLVEAFSQFYCREYHKENGRALPIIAPAIGYPSLPDIRAIKTLDIILDFKSAGITLDKESNMMSPLSSVCGLYIIHPDAKYFAVGKISDEQYADYAARGNETVEEVKKWVRL